MSIALSFGLRNSLNALSSLDGDIARTNGRLATGKKVSSALDNASIYFQAQGFKNKASSLQSIQDGLSVGLKTLEQAGKALESIDKALGSIKGLLQQATTLTGAAQTDVITQANNLRTKLDDFVKDAGFNGINLLNGTGAGFDLKVTFDAETPTSSTTLGVDFKIASATGLNLNTAFAAGTLTANITSVDTAIATTRSRASIVATDASLVQIRQSFTKDRVSILGAASDALTNADLNEEGANLSALQTRQQLAVTALSLANRSDQAILRLF